MTKLNLLLEDLLIQMKKLTKQDYKSTAIFFGSQLLLNYFMFTPNLKTMLITPLISTALWMLLISLNILKTKPIKD